MSNLDYYDGVVVDIIKETPNIRRFYIQVPELDVYDFKAGQYVKVLFPIDSKKNYRQYSIANSPDGTNIFELLIVLNPDGVATNYLFNEVKIGSVLKVSEPRGNFLAPQEVETDVCMICTGVGLAPLRSIYLDILNRNVKNKHIYLIFGTRFMSDLIYVEEMEALSKRSDFTFIPVLSRETSDAWHGKRGYLHNSYKEIFANKPDANFYICGWRDMVTETRNNLLEMGFKRQQIHFERYD